MQRNNTAERALRSDQLSLPDDKPHRVIRAWREIIEHLTQLGEAAEGDDEI